MRIRSFNIGRHHNVSMHMNQGEKLKLISVELGIMVDVFTYSDGGGGVTLRHCEREELDRLARKMDKPPPENDEE